MILLSVRNQRRVHIICFTLYKILKNVNWFIVTPPPPKITVIQWSLGMKGQSKEGWARFTKRPEEILMGLDMFTIFIGSFMGVYICQTYQIITLNMCSLVYVNYTLIKLLNRTDLRNWKCKSNEIKMHAIPVSLHHECIPDFYNNKD